MSEKKEIKMRCVGALYQISMKLKEVDEFLASNICLTVAKTLSDEIEAPPFVQIDKEIEEIAEEIRDGKDAEC